MSAFAPMGAEFSPEQLADYRRTRGAEPRMIRVAHCSLNPAALSGPLAVFVHESNPLASLTLAEVAEIFSGRNTRGLHPCGLLPETALGLFMRGVTLGGGGFGAGFRGFAQSREVVAAVAADPQAIGFAAAMRATPGVKMLGLARTPADAPVGLSEGSLRAGIYPLDRFLLIYVRTPLEPWVREYLRFVLSAEGQDLIARGTLGYLPLNAVELVQERAKLD
jgi:phosphate transport system substrate-binding protein